MEALEQLHKQLDSLRELRNIVRIMKTLSATSIRQYEQASRALADYYRNVERGLHVVLKDMQAPPAAPHRVGKQRPLGAIVFGSDHGLCGRFNEEIAAYTLARLDASGIPPDSRVLLAVGARVASSLRDVGLISTDEFLVPGSADQITRTVQNILLKIDEWRENADAHHVYLFYNRHATDYGYRPTGIELLPVNLRRFHRLEEQRWPSRSLPTFTMQREKLMSRLLRQYLFVSIFRACAESQASEHASRLTTMQSAERNLDERVREVTMTFRRARQTVITSQLLDVVSGFEVIGDNNG